MQGFLGSIRLTIIRDIIIVLKREKKNNSFLPRKYKSVNYRIYLLSMRTRPVHRGAFCQFAFQWIYYYGCNKSTGKELANRNSVQRVRRVTNCTNYCASSEACLRHIFSETKHKIFLNIKEYWILVELTALIILWIT